MNTFDQEESNTRSTLYDALRGGAFITIHYF